MSRAYPVAQATQPLLPSAVQPARTTTIRMGHGINPKHFQTKTNLRRRERRKKSHQPCSGSQLASQAAHSWEPGKLRQKRPVIDGMVSERSDMETTKAGTPPPPLLALKVKTDLSRTGCHPAGIRQCRDSLPFLHQSRSLRRKLCIWPCQRHCSHRRKRDRRLHRQRSLVDSNNRCWASRHTRVGRPRTGRIRRRG